MMYSTIVRSRGTSLGKLKQEGHLRREEMVAMELLEGEEEKGALEDKL